MTTIESSKPQFQNHIMKTKILLTFSEGKLTACIANGNVEVLAEVAETLDGVQQVPVNEIPCADLDALLQGRMPANIESEP